MSQINKTVIKPSLKQAKRQPDHELEAQLLPPTLPATQKTKIRSGAVTILGLLLLLQAVGLFDLGLFFFTGGLGLQGSMIMERLISEPVNTLVMSIIFIPLALLAALAALGFFRLLRSAWIMAMLTQSLSLLTALVLYFNQQPTYVYIIMLYSIFMVVYLNTSDVYTFFEPARILAEEEEEV